MPLKTLRTLPPGGWIYEQKTNDGNIRKFSEMGPFGDVVIKVQTYRKANGIKPDDVDSIAHELEAFTCARLGEDPKWCDSKKNSLMHKLSILPAHVVKAVNRVAEVGNGARIISDWLGDGGVPVLQELAQARTNVCLACPSNQDGHSVAKLTDKIAEAILEQRRQKLSMNLKVEGEVDLHTCDVCVCHLPLKVWVPMKTIADRTHPRLLEKFPDFCWMKTETSTPKETPCQTTSDGTLAEAQAQSVSTDTDRYSSDSNSNSEAITKNSLTSHQHGLSTPQVKLSPEPVLSPKSSLTKPSESLQPVMEQSKL